MLGLVATRKLKTGNQKFQTVRILFDSGSSGCLINHKLTKKLKNISSQESKWTTKSGTFVTTRKCNVEFILPELHRDKHITWTMHVDETDNIGSKYDIIIGRDLLQGIGIDLLFSTQEIQWSNATAPMRPIEIMKDDSVEIIADTILEQEIVDEDVIQRMTETKYSPADLQAEVGKSSHLTQSEQHQLLQLLRRHESLFDGTLGEWKTSPVHLELNEGASPYYGKPYPVPRSQELKVKQEVERMIKYKVLRKISDSEWGMPAFIIPKKDGITVRSIADLRELNKRIKRKPFPIPKIQDLLLKLENFQYGTSLDLNMGYYNIHLDLESQNMCVIVFPWGKYAYQRLPMGLCNAPDIFQQKMSELMSDIEYARAYIDDLLIISNGSFEDHLKKVEVVLQRLQDAGLKVNASKSFFAQTELEYLGYWISRDGIRPVTKKVEAINNLARPKTRRELRKFIGMVNHYRDMWAHRSDILTPLSELTSLKVPFKWKPQHEEAFENMKKVIARETILAFPDFDKPFHIYTDASDYQMGAVIVQDNKPIAFYSKKLNPAQTRYTTTEKELLSIVAVCKEFRNILLGQQLVIFTDHENLTYKNFNTPQVMRWRLFLEEYSPDIKWLKGSTNLVADALSRLAFTSEPIEESHVTEELSAHHYCFSQTEKQSLTFPLNYEVIGTAQSKDKSILKGLENGKYHFKSFHRDEVQRELICHKGKIVIPQQLTTKIMEWYHMYLGHPGINRTEETIAQHLWWPKMRDDITYQVQTCDTCQKNKRKYKKYGLLPPKKAEYIPWDRLCVDLIGPYTIRQKGKKNPLICRCVTMIDPATGWFEICQYNDKRAITVANIVEQEWLSRYPWPTMITFDQGSEFISHEFQDMIKNDYGIKAKPITT